MIQKSTIISRVALRTDGPGRKRNEHPDRGMTLYGVWQRQDLTIVNTYHAMSLGVKRPFRVVVVWRGRVAQTISGVSLEL